MDIKLNKNTYIFFRNSSLAEVGKKKFRENMPQSYIEDVNFTTVDFFIENQVKVFWNLIDKNSVKPLKISRNSSLCILYKIIDERRMFDSFFSAISSKNIFLAMSIYNIMMRSAQSGIPVTEIAPRIDRFKLGLKRGDTYTDLKNVIDEYRSILTMFKAVDTPMILESYEKLLEKDEYKSRISQMNFYIGGTTYENRIIYDKIESLGIECNIRDSSSGSKSNLSGIFSDKEDSFIIDDFLFRKIEMGSVKEELSKFFSEDIIEEKKYEFINTDDIRKKVDCASLEGVKFSGKYQIMDFDNYFDMIFELERLIGELLNNGVKEDEIALIFPTINSSIEGVLEKINEIDHIEVEKLSEKKKVSSSDSAISCITAYALAKNCYNIQDDHKVVFVKSVLEGLKREENEKLLSLDFEEIKTNNIFIRKNLNKLIREIIDSDSILPKIEEGDGAFLKSFYRRYCRINEEGIKEISQICDIIKEISMFRSSGDDEVFSLTDEIMIDFIRECVSTYTPVRRRIERVELKRIIASTYREYISSGIDRRVKILFDVFSPNYDEKVEDEIGTEIAYFEDNILSDIPVDKDTGEVSKSDIRRILNKTKEDYIKKSISRLLGKNKENSEIYITRSSVSIGGYDQENIFSDILINSLENKID